MLKVSLDDCVLFTCTIGLVVLHRVWVQTAGQPRCFREGEAMQTWKARQCSFQYMFSFTSFQGECCTTYDRWLAMSCSRLILHLVPSGCNWPRKKCIPAAMDKFPMFGIDNTSWPFFANRLCINLGWASVSRTRSVESGDIPGFGTFTRSITEHFECQEVNIQYRMRQEFIQKRMDSSLRRSKLRHKKLRMSSISTDKDEKACRRT